MLRYSLAVSGIGVVAGPLAADAPRPISTAEDRVSLSSRKKRKHVIGESPLRAEASYTPEKLLAVERAWQARGARGRGCRRQHAQADACHLTAG